ncbi:uncharacterized protein MELLADRAFT_95849 [Melampsora larici-populina 98AG31]|uniref:GCM domain-containing protein n=1 Tax=Melampsora larici-populina (strain 98AG31 / pathotype 3-4-7) TaxID=747676 RepID=F4RDG8_MELLP|nr:uncharacterized protein MELLADRAFT_95849 [Melampsora larici-populina 98AG31]EGG09612.1 hypothetical protein MELLADRAFT_95849 [Melampsora larici-populina 98AG31]
MSSSNKFTQDSPNTKAGIQASQALINSKNLDEIVDIPLDCFIGEDSKLDSQGYPLYPNGNTVWIKHPDVEAPLNFGKVGFSYTSRVTWSKNKRIKSTKFKCLGVLMCSNDLCDYRGPPPTGKGKIPELMAQHPTCLAPRCSEKLAHIDCEGTHTRVDVDMVTGWSKLTHSGIHGHPWPDSKKPDLLSKAKLAQVIVNNPDTAPFLLRVGRSNAGQAPIKSVNQIHPSLGHKDRLSYLRRDILVKAGLMPAKASDGGGDKLLLDMFHWNHQGLKIISSSFMDNEEHFTFQTQWMAERLMDRDEKNDVYRGGLLSDVTYKFFENGYLLTTSMYCEDLMRWIPVQLTWLRGLKVSHYKCHFVTLLKQFFKASMTKHECEILSRQVVDFSMSQKEGFVQAYMEVFGESDRARVMRLLKVCQEHFRQQVTRVKRNHKIIPPHLESDFAALAMGLLQEKEDGGKTHEEKLEYIRQKFPKVKRWLDWWQMSDVQAMVFPSRRPLPEDLPDADHGLPDTTNAQESMHRIYYMLC